MPGQEYKSYFFFDEISTFIYPAVNGSATVFAPMRIIDVKPSKLLTMLISFNTEGEVFSSRDINYGISYSIESEYVKYEEAGFKKLCARCPVAPG